MEVESASKSHDAGAVAKKKAIEVIRQAAPSPRDGERSGQVTRVRAEGFAEALAGRGTVVVLSRADSLACCLSEDDGQVRIVVQRLPGPMGLAIDGERLAIGCATDVRVMVDVSGPGDDERWFMPAGVRLLGAVSIHDLAWDDDGALWFTNTLFSTVCSIGEVGFQPRWRPAFIPDEAAAVDACHLNGMAFDGRHVRFATALAATGEANGWRRQGPDAGVLLDDRGEVLLDGLSLPHSPLLHDGRLFLLESGRGRLRAGASAETTLAEFDGVTRGLAAAGDRLFIGQSPVRASSGATTEVLSRRFPRKQASTVLACDLRGNRVASLALPFISEISSVHVVPGGRANFLRADDPSRMTTFAIER
jgi:uncharacterized protein (TIGR03032 family)